jgi:hypothetical protein
MREYLEGFMTEFSYPNEAICELLSAYDALNVTEELGALIAEYENSYDIDYTDALKRVRVLSERVGVHAYTGELLLYLCYTRALRRYYAEAGISDDVYLATVLDLRYKLDECRCVYGIYGSFVAYWFAGFFKLERFALGRLQFELIPLGVNYECDTASLKADSRVINVHIPRSGVRMDRDSIKEAYRLAAEFFRPYLGEDIAFVCNSWLLFPRHNEMLSESSNIRRFIGDYQLVSSGEYKDYSELWRLFDMNYNGDPTLLPSDTSLRRAYVDLIKRGEPTGWGRGIMIYDK